MATEKGELQLVRDFLRSGGFVDTEQALQKEMIRLSTVFPPEEVSGRRRPVDGPSRFQDDYSLLRTWALASMDPYKAELRRVLYPVFIHCCLWLVKDGHLVEARIFFNSFFEDHEKGHSKELYEMQRIFSANSQQHCSMENKFTVQLCEHSYELLIRYLGRQNGIVMLEIINQGIKFEVSTGHPHCTSTANLDLSRPYAFNKEAVAVMLKTGLASAVIGISAVHVIASKMSECSGNLVSSALLDALSYSYLPCGLIGVATGVGATKDERLLPLASVFFLMQLAYIIILGGVHAAICVFMVPFSKTNVGFIGAAIISCIIFISLFWGYVSMYPEFLHRYACNLGRHILVPIKLAGSCWMKCARIVCCSWRPAVVQAEVSSGQESDIEMGQRSTAEQAFLALERTKDQ